MTPALAARFARRPRRLTRWCRWGTLACVVLLALGSLMPSDPKATGLWAWDHNITPQAQDCLHVPAYAALAGAIVWGWWRAGAMAGRAILVVVLASAYGVALECAQAVIPGRCGSISDAMLNLTGAALGTVLAWLAGRWLLANARPSGGPGKVG